MANNYERSTVDPTLPRTLFTELELLTLSAFGMEYEPSNDDHLYFYSENPSMGNDVDVEQKMLNDKGNFVVKQYLDYIEANDKVPNPDGALIFDFNIEEINDDCNCTDCELTIETIFQSILRKKDYKEKEIVIMGAFTCDRLRMGEFGGFVTRITKDSIQHNGTYQMLEQMRHPEKIRAAVVLEGGLVQSVISDKPDNLTVISIDYDTDGSESSELTQVKQPDGSLSEALCINQRITESQIDFDEVFENEQS